MQTFLSGHTFKLTFVISFFTVILNQGFSQSYVPFPTENGRWLAYQYVHENFSREYELVTDGKKSINGLAYTKLYSRENIKHYVGNSWGPFKFKKKTFGYFRNDSINKKVYFIPNGGSTESLWYDFSLEVGDTVNSIFDSSSVFGETLIVQQIDSVLIDGNFRRRLIIDPLCNIFYIEGIGSTTGLDGFGICLFENQEHLICAQVDSVIVFGPTSSTCGSITSVNDLKPNDDGVFIWPNPANYKINFSFNSGISETVEIVFRDYKGQEVNRIQTNSKAKLNLDISHLVSGFYIYQVEMKSSNRIINGRFIKK